MKIAVIGAGAMGCLYGAYLSEAGHEVWLVDIQKDHVDAIRSRGLVMEESDGSGGWTERRFSKVRATTDPAEPGPVDLALVFVKSTLTGKAVEANRALLGPGTSVLTLQNGLGNVEAIGAVVGMDRVLAGTTAHGATLLGPGRTRHAGSGKTVLGEPDGSLTERLRGIAAAFSAAGLETEGTDNVEGLLWDKLLVNVGINALTALLEVPNGRLLAIEDASQLLEAAVEEGRRVAEAKGVRLHFPDPAAHAKEVCAATAANRSSMLQDILGGRATEIDRINGAVASEGRALGIATPVNETLVRLVHSKEAIR